MYFFVNSLINYIMLEFKVRNYFLFKTNKEFSNIILIKAKIILTNKFENSLKFE